jgi:hypothetical protein
MPVHPDAPGCCAMTTGGVGGYQACTSTVAWAGIAFGRRAFSCEKHQDLLRAPVPYGAREHLAELERRLTYWAPYKHNHPAVSAQDSARIGQVLSGVGGRSCR